MKGVALQVAETRYTMSVITGYNGVSERKQCFSCKCHVFNICFYKFLQRSTCLHNQLHHKPHYVLHIADVMLGSISGFDLFQGYL